MRVLMPKVTTPVQFSANTSSYLWCVGAHLEEQNVAGSVELAVSYDYILGIIALASKGDTSACFLEVAVLYDDVPAWSVGAVLVHEGSLTAF